MKVAAFLYSFIVFLADCRVLHEKRHKQNQPTEIDVTGLDTYLKNALGELELESRIPPTTKTQHPEIEQKNADKPTETSPTPNIPHIEKTSTLNANSMKPTVGADRMDQWHSKVLKNRIQPTIRPRARPQTKSRLPSWNVLKKLIKEEFMKDNLELTDKSPNIGSGGFKDTKEFPPIKTTPFTERVIDENGIEQKYKDVYRYTGENSFKFSDAKNWLLFGIGFGCSTMLCTLCIMVFHCIRYIKCKDGFFMKNMFQRSAQSTSGCMNNNNGTGTEAILTDQSCHSEGNGWSSEEEEVFNISIPRSFPESLSNFPAIKRSSSVSSTPTIFKTRQTLFE